MKKLFKRSFLSFLLALPSLAALFVHSNKAYEAKASPADSYYSSINWSQSGVTLKNSLFNLIKTHTNVGYNGLWNVYKTSDVRADGKLWDMYSAITNYTIGGSAQGASYKKEGDGYNREHTIPQSVFKKASPMVADAFHVYPTDGYVNNRRSSYPHANVGSSISYSSAQGLVKVGQGKNSGINGKVCEVADQYKGDFARTYFYFVTCYQDKMKAGGWGGYAPFNYSNDLGFNANYLRVYLDWAKGDPVSKKEKDRNEAVFAFQKNRNPFIDYPEAVAKIWDIGNEHLYTSEHSGDDPTPSLSLNHSNLTLTEGETKAISATYNGEASSLRWSVENPSIVSLSSSEGNVTNITALSKGHTSVKVASLNNPSLTATCQITVNEASVEATLDYIEVSGTLSAIFGGEISNNLIVTAHYSDGSSADVSKKATVSSFSNKILGRQEVEVVYEEKGIAKSETIEGHVTNVGSVQGSPGLSSQTKINPNTASNKVTFSFDSEVISGVATSASGIDTSGSGNFVTIGSKKNAGSLTINLKNQLEISKVILEVTQLNNMTPLMSVVAGSEKQSQQMSSGLTSLVFDFSSGALSDKIVISNDGGGRKIRINSINIHYGGGGLAFEDEEQSSAYANYFLSQTEGNCHDVEVWGQLATEYLAMSSSAKAYLHAHSSDAYLALFERYQAALLWHSMDDFMQIAAPSNNKLGWPKEEMNAFAVLLSIAIVSSSFLFIIARRKKKHN